MQNTDHELATIAAMQRQLLPCRVPQPPGWDIAVHLSIGRLPGGSYYDFLPLPDGRLVFLLADASDEGAPAAALVAMVRVMLHSCPLSSGVDRSPFCPLHGEVVQGPHLILENLNRVVAENSLEEQFVTAFCGILNPLEGDLHFANAGHPWPRRWHGQSRTIEPLRHIAGRALGMDPRTTYHHKRICIERSDSLLFYTAGVTAALDHEGFSFGLDRLDAAIQEFADGGADAVRDGIVLRLQEFVGSHIPRDDVALVVMKRRA